MKARWYISTVIFTLTLLGVINQQRLILPNQEIVLQFNDSHITTDSAKNTIALLKQQLYNLGVENIQIHEIKNGKLRIRYYSDAEAASIKNTLSKAEIIALVNKPYGQEEKSTKFPFGEESCTTYNLDVYEIQNGNDTDNGLEGTRVLNLESKSDRFLDPNVFLALGNLTFYKEDKLVKVAYKVYRYITISIGNNLNYIPEVRAGPVC